MIDDRGLLPENDPSALFINSGVHAIKPIILGIEDPPAKRLTSCQSCLRTVDIDKVGKTPDTLTFFYMLGSWSIGDYWKEEALNLAYRLLTNGFGLSPERLAVTVFGGYMGIPPDKESKRIWEDLGFSPERIFVIEGEDNLWSMGETGPLGPCTEVFYDRGEEYGTRAIPGDNSQRYVEIWNAGVFMEYTRDEDQTLSPLRNRCVDTGAGLERLTAVLMGKSSVFEVPPLSQLVELISQEASVESPNAPEYQRVISDHLRASIHIANEGVMPSNKLQGYVLRRLIRRTIGLSDLLGIENPLKLVEGSIEVLSQEIQYRSTQTVKAIFEYEYKTFLRTLERGKKQLAKYLDSSESDLIPGEVAFRLLDTYGFPLELTISIAKERGFRVDIEGFRELMEQHRRISKAN